MLHAFVSPLKAVAASIVPAAAERVALALNHLLMAEPVARQRLVPHAGRTLEVRCRPMPPGWPEPPPLTFRITPAGLSEWLADPSPAAEHDLHMRLDLSRPWETARAWAGGARPGVDIEGDAALAADLAWVVDNLRWDAQHDLERLVGPTLAGALASAAAAVAEAARALARAVPGRPPGTSGSPSR